MAEPQVVASRYALWKAAIKWPMYSVAVMPALVSAGWLLSQGLNPRWDQLLFLLAAVLLLAWENLSNDVFDADTGIDAVGKPHRWWPSPGDGRWWPPSPTPPWWRGCC